MSPAYTKLRALRAPVGGTKAPVEPITAEAPSDAHGTTEPSWWHEVGKGPVWFALTILLCLAAVALASLPVVLR
ncbi:hypothetical protein BDK92_7344 [Micromonospora pisi]|uniref:Uncharacterized protein n=1 Tax=Micromonospora pisi TaxID=589240 RepID=A0A495JWX7_9ACTN|nr:hypothetical protein [Micromonospora pisi]RKR92862.1 hypothetical protein BDK92_7344 [Micromonospora pisi]